MDMKYPFPKEYRNSGVFGSRRVFNGKPKSPHKGFDIAAPRGTIFYPVADGKVALTIDSYLNGKMILIDHGYGIYSAYLHSDEMMVKTGDTVSTKTPIGKVGSTGRSSGPHLHLGIYKNDMALNPEFFIK
jgi:murein DD-endopeptidase MepM/ murein hydrolase activator NlpD